MPGKMALLDFNKCQPEGCQGGICAAALACPSRLLKQDSPGSIPEPEPSFCRACGECVRACPRDAFRIIEA
jgi:translation initiation factor RLI1